MVPCLDSLVGVQPLATPLHGQPQLLGADTAATDNGCANCNWWPKGRGRNNEGQVDERGS